MMSWKNSIFDGSHNGLPNRIPLNYSTPIFFRIHFVYNCFMTLSVIIPIYNEINTLKTILERVQATGLADEILLVDDGSTDGTRDLLATLEGRQGIRVIFHEQNLGKGAAVRTGIAAATGDLYLSRMPTWSMIPVIILPCSNPLKKARRMWFMGRVSWVVRGG